MKDTLQRFLFEHAPVRGGLVRLDDTWQTILSRKNYPDALRHRLGELAAAAALLAAVARALDASAERQRARARALDVSARISTLTDRELEVARGVARGRINRLIAEDLGIALRTVKQHRQRAMEKLGVAATVDLARVMDEAGGG